MSDWLEHSVQVEVEAPIDLVWSLWSDLEQMPKWMKWIDSVKISPDDPEISIWKLSTGGLDFSWKSRMLKVIPNQIIQWQSVVESTIQADLERFREYALNLKN